MKLGVGEWGFRELEFEEHCKIAANLGFRYLELGTGGDFIGRLSADMSDQAQRLLRECIADYGLKTPFMCVENDFTKGSRADLEQSLEQLHKEALFAQKFGVTHLRLFAGFTPIANFTEQTWSNMLDALRTANEICQSLGMQISIETHGALTPFGMGVKHTPTASTDKAALKRMLKSLPDSVGINFDPGNLKPVQRESLESYADLLENRINYCHLKDWIQNDDGSWTAAGVGDGDIDWQSLLKKIHYDGIYLIEYEPTHDVEDGIRRSLDFLRRIVPEIEL